MTLMNDFSRIMSWFKAAAAIAGDDDPNWINICATNWGGGN